MYTQITRIGINTLRSQIPKFEDPRQGFASVLHWILVAHSR